MLPRSYQSEVQRMLLQQIIPNLSSAKSPPAQLSDLWPCWHFPSLLSPWSAQKVFQLLLREPGPPPEPCSKRWPQPSLRAKSSGSLLTAAHKENCSGTPCYSPRRSKYLFVTCLVWSGDWEKLRYPGKRAIWSSETRQVSLYCIFMGTNTYYGNWHF